MTAGIEQQYYYLLLCIDSIQHSILKTMMINRDILREIFCKLLIEEGFDEGLKLAFSGRECFNAFSDIILTAKKITLFSDSLKITFPKFDWFFGFDDSENEIPKFVWKRIAAIVPKLIIEQYSENYHKNLIKDLVENERILKIKIYSEIPVDVIKALWMPTMIKLAAPVDIVMKIFDCGVGNELKILTVIIGRGQLDLFRQFLYHYRISVNELKLKIQEGFVWDELLTTFSTDLSSSIAIADQIPIFNSISTNVTKLKIYFDKFCEFPDDPSNLRLSLLFQSLGFRFPSLKHLSILIEPHGWVESAYFVENDEEYSFSKILKRLSKFRLNPSFYIQLFDELSKQMCENEWNYKIEFKWHGEANILNENGPEVKMFKDVFGPLLNITDFDETSSLWRIWKQFSLKKCLLLDMSIRKIITSKYQPDPIRETKEEPTQSIKISDNRIS